MRITGSGTPGGARSLAGACQEVVRSLGDVQHLRVIDGQRIQVFSRSNRNPRSVARDIKTALLISHGFTVDLGDIEVVQLGQPSDGGFAAGRIQLKSVETRHEGFKITVSVELSLGERNVAGSAQGHGSQAERNFLAGMAALRALKGFLGDGIYLDLLSVKEVSLSGARAVLALVEWTDRSDSGVLLGSSLVRGLVTDSVIRAVLDALNRHLGWFSQTHDGR